MKIRLPLSRYGSGLYRHPGYFGLMLNGRMFVFRNKGHFTFDVWENIWRKTKRPCPPVSPAHRRKRT